MTKMSDDPELLRQCALSGQMSAAQIAGQMTPPFERKGYTDNQKKYMRIGHNFAVGRVQMLEDFAKRFLDPEDFAHAVTGEIRNAARSVLGIQGRETP